MRKKLKFIISIFILIFCLNPITASASEEFNAENRIINNSDVLTDEQEEDLNNLSIEISNECNKNIYIYFLSKNDGATMEFIQNYVKSYTLNSNSYVIGINPYLRTMYIYNDYTQINTAEILNNYSKDDFKNNDFYLGALKTMCGLADGYERKTDYAPPSDLITYNDINAIKLDSYIIDELDVLTAGQEEKIQSNSYRLKQNYGYDVYVMFTKSLSEYDVDDYVSKTYNSNFDYDSEAILVIFSLEDGKLHYSCGQYISLDVSAIYNEYARSYFHLEEPDYETGVCKLTNAIIANLNEMSIEDIENSVISGTTVKVKDTEGIKDILKIILLVVFILTLVVVAICIIKKYLIDDEIAKEKLINEKPEVAFSSLEKELSTVNAENIEYAQGVANINQNMDELYSEAASELINDELINEKHIKNKKDNIFDPRFEEHNDEDDVVISTIDEMIAKVVKDAEGTKEYYEQLQAALDIYNSLSFTNRTKLNRSNTSKLEMLTRKARMDKEHASRNS